MLYRFVFGFVRSHSRAVQKSVRTVWYRVRWFKKFVIAQFIEPKGLVLVVARSETTKQSRDCFAPILSGLVMTFEIL